MYCIRLWSKYISGCQRLSGYFTHINSMTKRKYHNYIYFMKKSSMKCHINTTLTSTSPYLLIGIIFLALCKQACILLHNRSPAIQYQVAYGYRYMSTYPHVNENFGISLALWAGILTTTSQHPSTNHIKFASWHFSFNNFLLKWNKIKPLNDVLWNIYVLKRTIFPCQIL